jgi:hypothetical protein
MRFARLVTVGMVVCLGGAFVWAQARPTIPPKSNPTLPGGHGPLQTPAPLPPTNIHIDDFRLVSPVSYQCGQLIHFQVVVTNSGAEYMGPMSVRITSPGGLVAKQFEVWLHPGVPFMADLPSSNPNVTANCCQRTCYIAELAVHTDGSGILPWDHNRIENCTTPADITVQPAQPIGK